MFGFFHRLWGPASVLFLLRKQTLEAKLNTILV